MIPPTFAVWPWPRRGDKRKLPSEWAVLEQAWAETTACKERPLQNVLGSSDLLGLRSAVFKNNQRSAK